MLQVPTKAPAFRRVAQDLRAQIARGDYLFGVALPTEVEVARRYSVGRQTVRRAFQDLVAEDLVFRVPGRGTFVTPSSGRYLRQFGSVEDLMALSADSQLQVLSPLTAAVDLPAASRLRLSEDRLAKVSFLRLHNGDAFSHSTVYLPLDVRAQLGEVQELAAPGTVSPVTVIGLLDQALEASIRDAEQSITVVTAPAVVSQGLGVPSYTAVLRVDRMYFDTEGKPVELAISHFHPDRYSYRVRLRRNLT